MIIVYKEGQICAMTKRLYKEKFKIDEPNFFDNNKVMINHIIPELLESVDDSRNRYNTRKNEEEIVTIMNIP